MPFRVSPILFCDVTLSFLLSSPPSDLLPSHLLRACVPHPDGLTLEDASRCMVGVWPTYIDFYDGPDQIGPDAVHCVINGVPIAVAARQNSGACEEKHAAGAVADAVANAAGDGHSKAYPYNKKAALEQRDDVRRTLCTTVVFQGALGGSRSVRADVPFPWADMPIPCSDVPGSDKWRTPQGWRTNTFALPSRRPSYVKLSRSELRYPHVFVAHVLSGSPFATLWPGHAKRGSADAACRCARRAAAVSVAGSRGGGRGNRGASTSIWESTAIWENTDIWKSDDDDEDIGDGHDDCWGDDDKDRGGGGNGRCRKIRKGKKGRCLPSSGPDPSFHVGMTAYFEITIGKATMPEVNNPAGGGMAPLRGAHDSPQSIAIGLATRYFDLR